MRFLLVSTDVGEFSRDQIASSAPAKHHLLGQFFRWREDIQQAQT